MTMLVTSISALEKVEMGSVDLDEDLSLIMVYMMGDNYYNNQLSMKCLKIIPETFL